MKHLVTIEVDLPPAYEPTGEYRDPASGDLYLDRDCSRIRIERGRHWRIAADSRRIILHKKGSTCQ